MRYEIEASVVEAELKPKLIRLGPNLVAACFFLMKLIPAHYVLERARDAGLIRRGSEIIESTSGSFGLALAIVSRLRGYRFTMVSDPVVDDRLRRRLADLGARVEIVSEPGPCGGYQVARLERLAQLMKQSPGSYCPRQYDNPWNVDAYEPLGQHLAETLGRVDVLVGTVGTGGSMCGIGRTLRRHSPGLRVLGVDTLGSVLFGQPDSRRLLRGLGNSIMPRILDHTVFDEIHWVAAAEGFRATRELHSATALYRGPTSGAAYLAARWCAGRDPGANVVVLFPDEGYRYESDVYDDAWLQAKGIYQGGLPEAPRFVAHPQEAGPGWSCLPWNRRTLEEVQAAKGIQMTKAPCLVLVESNTSGSGRLFARKAMHAGLKPVMIVADPARYPYVAEDRLPFVRANTADPEVLLTICRDIGRDNEIAGVASSSEYYVAAAARLAKVLGLPGPDELAIHQCRDKAAQCRRLQEAGVAVPSFRCVSSVEDALAAAQELGWPVVLKPVSGSGSVGVHYGENANEVEKYAALLLRQKENERGIPAPPRFLVESFVSGDEYSVETFGRQVVGVTRKHSGRNPRFVAIGHDFPAAIPASADTALRQAAQSALEALGLGWGPAHTEMTLTPAGPVVIEVNPRLAGALIPELVRLAHGIDLIAASIRLAIGQEPDLTQTVDRFASIGFLVIPRNGRLMKVTGLDLAASVPGVVDVQFYPRIGEELVLRGDMRDKIAHVTASGDASVAARIAVEQGLREIGLIIHD